MSANIHHDKYSLLKAKYEAEVDLNKHLSTEISKIRTMYQDEKLRADLLQRDLDNVDDFNIFAEHETMSRLKRKPS